MVSEIHEFFIFCRFRFRFVCNIDDILSFLTKTILQKCWPIFTGERNSDSKQHDKLIVSLDIDDALDKVPALFFV